MGNVDPIHRKILRFHIPCYVSNAFERDLLRDDLEEAIDLVRPPSGWNKFASPDGPSIV
jgi:hypothetical protein